MIERYQQIADHLQAMCREQYEKDKADITTDVVVKNLQKMAKIYFALNELDIFANASFGVMMVIQMICSEFFF